MERRLTFFLLSFLFLYVTSQSSLFFIPFTKEFQQKGSKPYSKPILKANNLEPIVFFNPLTGVSMEAKLTNVRVPHIYCWRNSDWYRIWIDFSQFVPLSINCWKHNFLLRFNKANRTLENQEGVEIRQVGFGNMDGMRFIDQEGKRYPYLNKLLTVFEQRGFKPGFNFNGACYDFRKTPYELTNDGTFERIKRLIEDTYQRNKQKVHVMGHSYGGPISAYFLANYVEQEWKDKYIKSYIPLGAPFDGSPSTLLTYAAYIMENAPEFLSKAYFDITASIGSSAWMIPQSSVIPGLPNIVTPQKNYSVSNLREFFTDRGIPNAFDVYEHTKRFSKTKTPYVPVNCVYPVGQKTPTLYKLDKLGGKLIGVGGIVDGDGVNFQ